MKSTLKFSSVFAALFILLLTSCSDNGTSLRFKLKEGNTYEYVMDVEMNQDVAGQSTQVLVGTTFTMEPVSSQDSTQTIKTTYDRFTMKMNAGGMTMNIDTDKPAGEVTREEIQQDPQLLLQVLYTSIKGKSFTMNVNNKGDVVSVTGMQEVLMSMVESLGMPEEQKAQMAFSLKDQFSEQAIRDQFGSFFNAFNDRTVKVGDTWDAVVETKGRMGAKYTSTYTVKSIADKNVTLDVASKVEGTDAKGLNGTQQGTIVLNTDLGLLTSGTINQDLKMPIQDDISMDVKGKLTITGKVK